MPRERLDPSAWDVRELAAALALLAGEWTPCRATVRVDPRKVLAAAWNQARLERCRRRLAAGEEPPAASVVGYRFGGVTLYGVSDGVHRTVAAREAGRKVKVRIGGHYAIEPGKRLVAAGLLWDTSPRPDGLAAAIGGVDGTQTEALRRLGIEVRV